MFDISSQYKAKKKSETEDKSWVSVNRRYSNKPAQMFNHRHCHGFEKVRACCYLSADFASATLTFSPLIISWIDNHPYGHFNPLLIFIFFLVYYFSLLHYLQSINYVLNIRQLTINYTVNNQ